MKNYETAGARDAARMVRRGIFGYLLARFILIPLFVLSVIVFVIGCFATLFWLAAQPSSASTPPASAASASTMPSAYGIRATDLCTVGNVHGRSFVQPIVNRGEVTCPAGMFESIIGAVPHWVPKIAATDYCLAGGPVGNAGWFQKPLIDEHVVYCPTYPTQAIETVFLSIP